MLTKSKDATTLRLVRRRAGHFKPIARVIAGALLVLWTMALVACSAHCFLGTSHLGMAQQAPSCHAAPLPCHGGTPNEEQSDSGALCATLKQMSIEQHAAGAPQLSIFVLYFLAAEEVASGHSPANASELRQHFPAKWTITPEVYLGVTNLPHGPPLIG